MHRALANGCGITEPSDLGDVALEDEASEVTAIASSFGVEPAASMLARRRIPNGAREEPSPTLASVGSRLVKRRLEDVQRQLSQARESLAVLEEQVAVWNDALDDARIRALVGETPLQSKEYDELSRHVQVANAEMKRRAMEVRELMAQRDELLREWTPKDDNG